MNVLRRELKSGLKPFIFWTIGLVFLVFAGMMKYTGISAGNMDMDEILDQFPKVVLAIFGMVGVDINTLGGYYSVLMIYVMICGIVYAIYLGYNAVARESVDKTYEFIFTKPYSRSYILTNKLLAAFVYLISFCILNYIFSLITVAMYDMEENIKMVILLYSIAIFLISLLFFALSTFIATIVKRAEKGASIANLCFLFTFFLGIVYDMVDNGKLIKVFAPMKYFEAKDLIDKNLDVSYVILSVVLIMLFMVLAYITFNKKDLTN